MVTFVCSSAQGYCAANHDRLTKNPAAKPGHRASGEAARFANTNLPESRPSSAFSAVTFCSGRAKPNAPSCVRFVEFTPMQDAPKTIVFNSREQNAIALLNSGGSFADAMTAARLSYEQVKELWDRWAKSRARSSASGNPSH
jgi:hypothetical protein